MECETYKIDINPIYFIKITKFPTGLKEYETLNKTIQEEDNFFKRFPSLINYVKNFETLLLTEPKMIEAFLKYEEDITTSKFIDDTITDSIKLNMNEIEKEILLIFPEEWNSITYMNGKTKIHIIYSLILTYYDIRINKKLISDYDENILLWAILLHDIAKHVKLQSIEEFEENM